MSIIEDGTGKGFVAKVDAENRLHTHAFTVTINQAAALQGDAFSTSTGIINLTSDCESAIFHIENTSDDDFLIFEQFLILGTSTCGVGSPTVTYHTNPTSGTIISNAVCITPSNRRLASSNILDAVVYKGVEGDTLTGATENAFVTNGFFNLSPFVLPKGVSLSISITPPTGNTSLDVTFGLNLIADASQYGND